MFWESCGDKTVRGILLERPGYPLMQDTKEFPMGISSIYYTNLLGVNVFGKVYKGVLNDGTMIIVNLLIWKLKGLTRV